MFQSYHYSEINFIVPDYAYSAGTIFCMSGNSIYMDYSSVLGPIDPQVLNKDNKYVAALGYLDKVNEFIAKAAAGTLTNAELIWLKEIDLGELRSFEQARDLTIDLLRKWLVTYKFKNWNTHSHDGSSVSLAQKEQRAEEIARDLSDNKKFDRFENITYLNLESDKTVATFKYVFKFGNDIIQYYYEKSFKLFYISKFIIFLTTISFLCII